MFHFEFIFPADYKSYVWYGLMPVKYGLTPEHIESKSLNSEEFREVYDFHRLEKLKQDADRI